MTRINITKKNEAQIQLTKEQKDHREAIVKALKGSEDKPGVDRKHHRKIHVGEREITVVNLMGK